MSKGVVSFRLTEEEWDLAVQAAEGRSLGHFSRQLLLLRINRERWDDPLDPAFVAEQAIIDDATMTLMGVLRARLGDIWGDIQTVVEQALESEPDGVFGEGGEAPPSGGVQGVRRRAKGRRGKRGGR